jgi:hypothetical protein
MHNRLNTSILLQSAEDSVYTRKRILINESMKKRDISTSLAEHVLVGNDMKLISG